jgi:hypothetical protein
MPALLKITQPFVLCAFRKENVRILAELKRYVEAPAVISSSPRERTV